MLPKVSAETTKPNFFVGLALKRLTAKGIQSSNDVWVFDAASGRLYHGGEKGEALFVMSDGGDSITVEFDSVAKTLSFGKNDEPLKVAFQEISKLGEELFPALFFNKKSGATRVSASVLWWLELDIGVDCHHMMFEINRWPSWDCILHYKEYYYLSLTGLNCSIIIIFPLLG